MFLQFENSRGKVEAFSTTPFDTVVNIARGAGPWSPATGFSLRVTWGPGEEPPTSDAPMQPILTDGEIVFCLAETPEKISLRRDSSLSLSLDFVKRCGEVRLSQPREWQNVLRIVYFHLLLEGQGLLLHASALAGSGEAYVFPGPSGAGKTSIVQQSPGMLVLTDEIAAVDVSGNGHPPQAHGTPFFGDWGCPGKNVTAPLRGLYFPVQDRENRLVPLTPAETLTRLLPCVCSYTTRKDLLQILFDTTIRLTERIPGFDLHFRPEPELWQAIHGS
jgi:hypothetical protein